MPFGPLARAGLAGAFFAAGFLRAFLPRFRGVRSPASRLFFSAAIRSITFEPLPGASELVSWMTRLPFFFCFSAISAFSASI